MRLSSIVFLTLLVLGTTAGPSWAESDERASTAISIGTSQVTVRHQFSPENGAFFGAFYQQFKSTEFSPDLVSQTIDLTLGYRRYLTHSDISSFIDLQLAYVIRRLDQTGSDKNSSYNGGIFYGIEKLLTPRLSLEGSAGAFMSWGRGSSPYQIISFPVANLAVNYYF